MMSKDNASEENAGILAKTFKHKDEGYVVKVVACDGRAVTTECAKIGKTIKFNQEGFVSMVSEGLFIGVNDE